ncbi:hypothetical protein C3489_30725 [Streptomyces sp. Ru71]|nr:hypothetical protein C3489_30725 [Streptomyces sp. Ru71]
MSAAVAVGAAQLPAAVVLLWCANATQDDYGAGGGGAFGVFFAVLFAPLALPLLGAALALGITLPAVLLTRLGAGRLPGPAWLWHLAAPAVPACAWGAAAALVWHWPFTTTAAVLTALAALPTWGVAQVRKRAWRTWGVWWRSALGSVVLALVVLVGGIAALATGLVEEFRPPHLTTARLAGDWRGASGAELRLDADGRARAVRLPARPGAADDDTVEHVMCDGSGTWEPDADAGGTDREGILLHLDGDCGADTHWSFSGTDDAPELFALFGDPGVGTLWILERR